jgi:hypothetical protein
MDRDRKISLAQVALFVGGFFMAYQGWRSEMSWMTYGGLVLVGAAVLWWGVEAIVRREDSYSVGDTEVPRRETYVGFAAVMSGSVMALLGLAILVAGVVGLLGLGEESLALLQERPGIAFVLVGLAGVAFSFTLIIGSQQDRSSASAVLGSLPGRVFGVLLLVAAIGAILLGGLQLASPETYESVTSGLRGSIVPSIPE